MSSSGQSVTATEMLADCVAPCKFSGDVEVVLDFETLSASWECPACDARHDAGDPRDFTR